MGGDYDTISEVTTGPITEICAREYHVDKIFIGIGGYREENRFTDMNHTRCNAVRSVARQADKVIVLTTSDKFGKRSVAQMLAPNEIHSIVTDSRLSQAGQRELIAHGIRLELVDADENKEEKT